MEEFAKYSGLLALVANFLWIPAMNYFIDRRFDKKMEPMEARFMKAIADQKIQIDREYLDLRDSFDRKMDKLDICLADMNRQLITIVQSTTERMTKNELDVKGLLVSMEAGSKNYELFQRKIDENFTRVHERLDSILERKS